jgi:hypothetical protein
VTTTSESTHQEFPAVDRVAEELRVDLLRAARAHAAARPRLLSRRGIIGSIVAVALVGTPASLAGAGVFDPEPALISYECIDAKAELEPLNPVTGVPTEGPAAPVAVTMEPLVIPDNPCAGDSRAPLPPLPASRSRD